MGCYKYLDSIIENKLNSLHTVYLAKVLSVNGKTAKIQPLGLKSDSNGNTYKQSVLTEVPITKKTEVSKGDVAVCVCCERNISEAKHGINSVTPAGRHSMSDSIIIGVL